MVEFSEHAQNWVRNYSGSMDTTALLLAFDAGRTEQREADALIALSGSDGKTWEPGSMMWANNTAYESVAASIRETG
jgi:hypothetical protein